MAIVEVVKYNGPADVFAWKYPSEELGTWTQLIVNESQEAMLFKGGQALDVFRAGRHTLETANIPILNKIVNLPFGGRSPFTAEVWFINKVHNLDIKWGTPTPIQLQDPKYKIFIPVRSFGQFGIQVDGSTRFITKLVGTMPIFDKTSIINYFRGLFLTKVKDSISGYLVKKNVSVLEINAYIDELSTHMQDRIRPILDEYGINLVSFYINDISVPETDPAVMKLKDALSKRAEMDIVGYSYTQERSFDTLEGAAKNPSSGQAGLMGAGIGLSMGVGIGNTLGSQLNNLSQNISPQTGSPCPKCQVSIDPNARFCHNCGFDIQSVPPKEANNNLGTICSGCGSKVDKSSKFCPECGKTMISKCPDCSTVVECSTKFCPNCGKNLKD